MKVKGLMKKLAVCMLIGVLLMTSAVPVFAASYTKSQEKLVDTGQSYHVMNNNISRNKISKYTISILTLERGTRYDLALAYAGREEVIKNRTASIKGILNKPAVYVKSSSSSNAGMLACIKVIKGSVRVKVSYTAGYRSAALTFKKQASSHQTLKAVTVKKNKKVIFQQPGSNITSVPLIMSSKTGSVTRRALNGTGNDYENYTFNSNSLNYRHYSKGILKKNTNTGYDTKLGTTRYIMVSFPNRLSGWLTTKKGTVTFYYPTDYLKISRIVK